MDRPTISTVPPAEGPSPVEADLESRALNAYGVDYHRIDLPDGGEMYLTDFGWPIRELLRPEHWYADRRFVTHGEKLHGATGTVYHVPTLAVNGRSTELLVKFSRVGQDVPLEIPSTFPDEVAPEVIANARFNSPFEEFALLMALRETGAVMRPRVYTQRPLAIYAPPESHEPWKLGRSTYRFEHHNRSLRHDQSGAEDDQAIALDIRRTYVLLFSWVKGADAVAFHRLGRLTQGDLLRMTERVIDELRTRGFRVLDNKPSHFILRADANGEPLQRHGEVTYALVDYELLQHTEEHHQAYRAMRRRKYWEALRRSHRPVKLPKDGPLRHARVLGVDYIYGTAPNGAKIWVVGKNPDLFDYFLPDRWRRAPRIRLSPISAVYRTRSRDGIYLIYRRSRLGEKPYADPFYETERQIRDFGFNSPFEEVAIAEELRRLGVHTSWPRAIYQTGHESTPAQYMMDGRRYEMFADLRLPDDAKRPILSPRHDYFTLWGHWRGIDPSDKALGPSRAYIDVHEAHERGLLGDEEFQWVIERTYQRLERARIAAHVTDSHELLLVFEADRSRFTCNADGTYQVRLAINGLSAYDIGLISEGEYRAMVEHQHVRLGALGFTALNLKGHHLLLSLTPDGEIRRDAAGHLDTTLCNFELIRMDCCAWS